MGKFTISKRKNDEYQFDLKAGNGEIILTSEGYTTKANCHKGIESVRANSQDDSRYDRRVAVNEKDYFVLKSKKRRDHWKKPVLQFKIKHGNRN